MVTLSARVSTGLFEDSTVGFGVGDTVGLSSVGLEDETGETALTGVD